MAFKLSSVVPWGRNFYEYKLMFALDDNDLKKKIADLKGATYIISCPKNYLMKHMPLI